jgi:RHS repeat-associated protein
MGGGVKAQSVNYQPFYDATTINLPALNANPMVGTINGADNSGNGTAGYTIPIEIPKGTNGMEPNVSISYNSGLHNGLLGCGTSLNAISAITRGSKSIYYDGKFDKINGTMDDAFYMDGQRLIKISSTIVGTNTEYLFVPEAFGQVQIHAIGATATPSKINHWRVTSSSGSVIEYGKANNSILLGENGSPSELAWRINKSTDAFGNYCEYKYINTTNARDYRLSEINYTGNALQGLSPYNKIAFSYKVRTDKNKVFMAGASICTDYVLDKIEVTTEANAKYRTYEFGYAYNGQYSFLIDVTLKGADGITALNKTKLKYYAASADNIETATDLNLPLEVQQDDNLLQAVDGNMDGLYDLICELPIAIGNNGISRKKTSGALDESTVLTLNVNQNLGSGASFVNNQNLFTNWQNTSFNITNDGSSISNYSNDLDLNGKPDFLKIFLPIKVTSFSNNTNGKRLINYNFLQNGVNNSFPIPDPNNSFGSLSAEGYNALKVDGYQYTLEADFNGDGLLDRFIIAYNESNNCATPCWLFPNWIESKKGFIYLSPAYIPEEVQGLRSCPTCINQNMTTDFTPKQMSAIDFNGDGKMEVMILHHHETSNTDLLYIYAFSKGNNSWVNATELYYEGSIKSAEKYIPFGDFNGDGITDLVDVNNTSNNSVTNFFIRYGTGVPQNIGNSYINGQITPFTFPLIQNGNVTSGSIPGSRFYVSDFDGDGLSDILMDKLSGLVASPTIFREFEVYYSNGFGFHKKISTATNNNILFANAVENRAAIGDFNGDGGMDIIYKKISTNTTTNPLAFTSFKPNNKERFVEKIVNGMGNDVQYKYENYTNNPTFYVKGTTAVYPMMNIVPSGFGLREVLSANGGFTPNSIVFAYENALVNRQGKGSLGFEKITTITNHANAKSIQYNSFDALTFTPYPLKIESYLASTNQLLKTIEYTTTFAQITVPNITQKLYFAKQDNIYEYDHITSTFVNTANEYDNALPITNGLLTKITKNISNMHSTVTQQTYVVNRPFLNYLLNSGNFLNVPAITTIVNTRIGQAPITTTKEYQYWSYKLNQTIDNLGTPIEVSTLHGYDVFGNNMLSTFGQNGMPSITKAMLYDAKGRFIIKNTNEQGQHQLISYNTQMGLPSQITEIDGSIVTMAYDAFNTLTTKTFVSKAYNINYSKAWAITGQQLFYTYVLHPGAPDSKTYFDKLGREIKTETDGFSGLVTTKTEYNADGTVLKKSAPYLSSETPMYTGYTYDAYKRTISVAKPLNTATIAYTFAGGTSMVRTIDGNADNTITKDATGVVTKIKDNAGTVKYEYNSLGQEIESKANTSIMSTKTFDAYGRLLIDHNSAKGNTTYTYDGYSQLLSSTDANGAINNYTYDNYGRVITKTQIEPGAGATNIINYLYNNSGNGINLLAGITQSSNGVNEDFTYDAFSRLINKRVTVDGILFNHDYTYNAYDQELTHSYPNALITENVYNADGHLMQIKKLGAADYLYKELEKNGLGQTTKYQMGNGKQSTISYYKGLPTNYTTGGIQNYDLIYNYNTGNITRRREGALIEDFTYDINDRLTSAKVNGQAVINYDYDYGVTNGIGNLTQKSDVGHYNYVPFKGAVTEIYATNQPVTGQAPLLINQGQQDISYTAFNRVKKISEAIDLGANVIANYEQTFEYYHNADRVKSIFTINGTDDRTRYYISDYEEQISYVGNLQIAYISSPVGLSIMVVNAGGAESINYVYTDHLGSPVILTDETATIIAKQSFDAWGKPRNADDWLCTTTPNITNPTWLWRGFTGHEMMTEFALVNMNARLYDYVNGRMCEPDVAISGGTQGQNRYSYARNNPMRYNDPSGNNPLLAGALIGGFINVVLNFNNINSAGQFFGYFAVGAVGGMLGAGVGGAIAGVVGSVGFTAGALVGAGSGFAGGFAGGFGNSMVAGEDIGEALMAGAKGGLTGALLGGITNGLVNGISAYNNDGNFFSGDGMILGYNEIDPLKDARFTEGKDNTPVEPTQEGLASIGDGVVKDPNATVHLLEKPKNGFKFGPDRSYLTFKDHNGIHYVDAVTKYNASTGGRDIYLMKHCFQSKDYLHIVFQHEHIHSIMFSYGYEHSEGPTWSYMKEQSEAWGLGMTNAMQNSYINNTHNDILFENFRKFGIKILDVRPWLK